MKALTEPLLELEGYQNVLEAILKNHTPVFTTGVIDVEKTHLLYTIKEHSQRPLLILTYSELRAREILEDLSFFHKNAIYYPAKDILFYSADVHSVEMNRHRFSAMERLLAGERPIIVASAEALLDRYPPKEIFTKSILTLKVGDIIDINKLTKQLICLGYERAELVESAGQFALRGGILDIFSLTAEDAVRIEFWDDEIDSIRAMDATNQRSVDKLEEARIFPMRELVYEESLVEQAANKISKEFAKCFQNMTKKGLSEESERLKENIGEDAERLRIEKNLANIGVYISYFYENTVSLLDYIPEDTLLCFDEPERIREHMAAITQEYGESMKGRIAQGYLLPGQAKLLFDYTDILRQGEKFGRILLAGLSQRTADFEPKVKVDFAVRSTPSFRKRVDLFCEELQYLKKNEYRTLILGGTGSRAQRMAKELVEMGIPAVYMESLDSPIPKGAVWVSKGSLSKGFGYEYIKLT
ncbi:MAG: transcription-repair coupling factor, partial [Anaerotignum sp.]|nr:transcription-repair coupling factor [Anaerotignum sp.]